MKVFILLLVIVLSSCNNATDERTVRLEEDSASAGKDQAAQFPVEEMKKDSSGTFLIWRVDAEKMTRKKNPAYDQELPSAEMMIQLLNQKYPNIRIDRLRVSGDTLYTEIRNSDYLGQRMGSFGAEAYIAEAIINLTATPGINFVNISMNAGSHISPGVWGEADYVDFKEVN